MSKKRRNQSPQFKAKVALAAIKENKTLSELYSHIISITEDSYRIKEKKDWFNGSASYVVAHFSNDGVAQFLKCC